MEETRNKLTLAFQKEKNYHLFFVQVTTKLILEELTTKHQMSETDTKLLNGSLWTVFTKYGHTIKATSLL